MIPRGRSLDDVHTKQAAPDRERLVSFTADTMTTIPAPTRFTDLRQHLHDAQIDAAYLCHVLTQYLDHPDNMPQQNWFIDPLEDHQAWDYRNALITFQQIIVDKSDDNLLKLG